MNYKIKAEAIVTDETMRNYIYEATTAGLKREGQLFVYPVTTVKTSKKVSMRQQANFSRWMRVSDLEQA